MPVILLERIPLPSLQTYTTFSVLLLSCAILYAHQIVNNSIVEIPNKEGVSEETHEFLVEFNGTLPYEDYKWNMLHVLTMEVLCVWVRLNVSYFGIDNCHFEESIKTRLWNTGTFVPRKVCNHRGNFSPKFVTYFLS